MTPEEKEKARFAFVLKARVEADILSRKTQYCLHLFNAGDLGFVTLQWSYNGWVARWFDEAHEIK